MKSITKCAALNSYQTIYMRVLIHSGYQPGTYQVHYVIYFLKCTNVYKQRNFLIHESIDSVPLGFQGIKQEKF